MRRYILGKHYFVHLDATFGAWQAHDTSVHLIFPALHFLLYEVFLEEEEEYKNYFRIAPETFNKLFVLVKDNITNYKIERCKHTKTKACCKNISC